MDDSLLSVVLIVMGVNVILWLGQVAALELNPTGPQFYNCQDSILGQFEASNCTSNTYDLNDEDPAGRLPGSGGEIEVDSGEAYTDTFSATINWFTDSTGISYLYNIVAAPTNFLKAIGVPSAFAFGIGVMWYVVTLLLIVAFVLGR